ncbi:MAG TPA: hypothetical protein PLB62_09260 [Candidatus Sumerlaeota bacterium]|nr:hypothetical protein [Candidatus Sumerlaeota bacterium]
MAQERNQQVFLSEGVEITPAEYERLQQELCAAINADDLTLCEGLAAGSVLLGCLGVFLERVAGEPSLAGYSRETLINTFFQKMTGNNHLHLMNVLHGSRSWVLVQRILVPLFTMFHPGPAASCGRLRFIWLNALIYLKAFARMGKIFLPLLNWTGTWADLERYPLPADNTMIKQQIRQWMTGLVERDVLLKSPDLLQSYHHTLLCFAVMRWVAAALAAQNRVEITPGIMARAMEIADRDYLFSPETARSMEANPLVFDTIQGFLKKREYGASLVCDPINGRYS